MMSGFCMCVLIEIQKEFNSKAFVQQNCEKLEAAQHQQFMNKIGRFCLALIRFSHLYTIKMDFVKAIYGCARWSRSIKIEWLPL